MADEVDMIIVDGVRYRPEHAPKTTDRKNEEDVPKVQHKMRTTKATSSKKE